MKKGVQMYTLRNCTGSRKALEKALEKIAKIGYDCVQGGNRGVSPEEYQKMLEAYGLFNATASASYEQMVADPAAIKEAIRQAKIYNTRLINVGTLPKELRESEAGYRFYAKCVNKIGAELKKEGMMLTYHPHALESYSFGGGFKGLDILFDETDPEAFGFVLDTHWLTCAGLNVPKWIRKAKGRMTTIHFKDYKILSPGDNIGGVNKMFAEIGEGNLDWPPIIEACREIGIENVVVEQDICEGDPFDSLEISFNNMVKMGV